MVTQSECIVNQCSKAPLARCERDIVIAASRTADDFENPTDLMTELAVLSRYQISGSIMPGVMWKVSAPATLDQVKANKVNVF